MKEFLHMLGGALAVIVLGSALWNLGEWFMDAYRFSGVRGLAFRSGEFGFYALIPIALIGSWLAFKLVRGAWRYIARASTRSRDWTPRK